MLFRSKQPGRRAMLSLTSTGTYPLRRSIWPIGLYPPRFSSPFHCTRSSPPSIWISSAPWRPFLLFFFLLHASANPAHRERGGPKGVTPPSLSPSSCRPVTPPPLRPSSRSPPRSTTSLQGKASRRGPRETRCARPSSRRGSSTRRALRGGRRERRDAAGRSARRGAPAGGRRSPPAPPLRSSFFFHTIFFVVF